MLWKAFEQLLLTHSTHLISPANIKGGFDWTRSSGLTSRSTVVNADGDISEEAENIKAHQVILKTTTSQGSGINSFNIKPGPRLRQYLHSTSRLQQLWSTSAQDAIVNNLRAVQRSCAMRLLVSLVVWCLCSGLLCWLGWSAPCLSRSAYRIFLDAAAVCIWNFLWY